MQGEYDVIRVRPDNADCIETLPDHLPNEIACALIRTTIGRPDHKSIVAGTANQGIATRPERIQINTPIERVITVAAIQVI
jgi:hypothetical protein